MFLELKSEQPRHEDIWQHVLLVHIIFACLAVLTGAINFMKAGKRKFHKIAGYLYVIAVIIVDLTSGYMAPDATGGKATSVPFNLLNAYWVVITLAAVHQARKQKLDSHRRCMIRSYMFCFTNMTTHLLCAMLENSAGLAYEVSYIIAVNASIVLLIGLGEIIARVVVPVSRKPVTSIGM